ncbi:hypothetical protein [Hydrogenovibrio halophilus]|uniref:hypothetical protein n=1 Tax=Hydrogenovibrio halophilus TaxID=373391 RepID=UPI000376AB63|nr:hypothetical protein [Hydrogenovibrio halophilus]
MNKLIFRFYWLLILAAPMVGFAETYQYQDDYITRAKVGDQIDSAWLLPEGGLSKRYGFSYPVVIESVQTKSLEAVFSDRVLRKLGSFSAFQAIYFKAIEGNGHRRLCLYRQEKPLACSDSDLSSDKLTPVRIVFRRVEKGTSAFLIH